MITAQISSLRARSLPYSSRDVTENTADIPAVANEIPAPSTRDWPVHVDAGISIILAGPNVVPLKTDFGLAAENPALEMTSWRANMRCDGTLSQPAEYFHAKSLVPV